MKTDKAPTQSRLIALCATCVLLAIVGVAQATTYKVPNDFTTIQAAINQASSGDMIWVAQGTYKENLVLKPGLRLEGGWKSDFSARNWNVWASVVDGDRKDSVVIGARGATLDGFTLRNGQADLGGGLRMIGANMTVQNNTIEDNRAANAGGGIYIDRAPQAPPYTDIQHNIVRRNQVTSDQGGTGGGISVHRSSQGIRITDNVIGGAGDALGDGNTARWGGGGISVEGTPVIQIERNTIRQNHVERGHGGGVEILDGSPNATLGQNVIEFNSANGNLGGGVFSVGGTFITRNRIGKNSLFNSPSAGGGLAVNAAQGTVPTIENNFIYANTADEGGGVLLQAGSNVIFMNNSIANNKSNTANRGGGMAVSAGATCILQNTILWANGDDLYEETPGACTLDHNDIEDGDGGGANGNISANPLFVAYDDLHIGQGSPAINAGQSAAAPGVDIDGDARSGAIDIGADEYKSDEGGTPCALVRTAEASYLQGHLDTVRGFRDDQLKTTAWGRRLVQAYYADWSPAISAWLQAYPWLKPVARVLVTPVVYMIAYPFAAMALLAALLGLTGLAMARRR